MLPTADTKSHPRARLWLFGAATLGLLVAVALVIDPFSRGRSFSWDPRFILTAKPRFGLPPNSTFRDRVFLRWIQLRQKFAGPRPVITYSFPPTPTNRCSIHGTLNQCMQINGLLYVIAKDVAPGTVRFGHTNTLSGPKWVAAFTEALQTGQPEWWDPRTRTFRKENLVLLTNRPGVVLVLPQDMAPQFQPAKPN